MTKLELITSENADRVEEIGPTLAETYRVAFAGEPWNEASRCQNIDCAVTYSGDTAGCDCLSCGASLVEAYPTDQLISNWQENISDGGIIEVAYLGDEPQRATIARPTTPSELYNRKYQDVPEMRDWLTSRLPGNLIWIEDTFANRDRQAKGNLNQRGKTLTRIAEFYGGMQIATRTLSEAIVASTIRDLKGVTATYIGSRGVGSAIISGSYDNPGYALPSVPDRRTLLRINLTGAIR